MNLIVDLISIFYITLTRPLRKKFRMRWFFDVTKVKESSFSKSDLTDPPQIFDAHLLVNTNLSPSSFNFSVGFYIMIMFWVRWFHTYFFRITDESALIGNFLRNGRVRGKPIGRVRVKILFEKLRYGFFTYRFIAMMAIPTVE